MLLGSAGTLLANRDFVAGEEMFLVVNADNLTDFDLRMLVDAHRESGRSRPIGVPGARAVGCGIVEVAGRPDRRLRGEARATHQRPRQRGPVRLRPEVFDEIPEPLPRDIGFDLLPRLVGRAAVVPLGDAYFADIGTPAALEHARDVWEAGRRAMIITRTPLRVGLVGGGTDLPDYYREHGGRVLNAAIDKYVYVVVKQRFDDDIYVNYSSKEIVSRVEDLEHELVREALHMAGVRGGVEITTLADIPSAGSGLGSSSAVTVGLLQALFAYQGRQLTAEELADRACAIEIDRCRKPIGKQDQYAAAYGGVCDIRFGPGDRVVVDQLPLTAQVRRAVQDELLLFFTGITRSANTILGEQTANIADRLPQLGMLRDLAGEAANGLREGDVDALGVALNKSWSAKRELASGVSNPAIDEAVEAALGAGAPAPR